MPSDTENYLRVIQVQMDALGLSLEKALGSVPESLRQDVRRLHEEQRPSEIAQPAVLSKGSTREWWSSVLESEYYYWSRLREWLVDVRGRHPEAVRNLDLESTRVVRLLGDPRPPPLGSDKFRVQGLVVGYVQSGKTANFTATIAKAADAGYRLFIVLAGIHNTLRRQTQQRLELEFGLRPERDGVPAPSPEKAWVTLTKPDLSGDFRAGTMGGTILHGNQPILAVVKKNGAVLRRLLQWIGIGSLGDLPVLIIDDEADQASVNTGGNQPEELSEDERPSTINRLIRDLIKRFQRVSYVAYTATPFANVFIDHEGMDREVMQDLYPRDFIVALDKPHGYVGAGDLFGRPALREEEALPGLDITVEVSEGDVAQVIPPRRKKTNLDDGEEQPLEFQASVSISLEEAIKDFVLLGAGFLARKVEKDRPSTPLTMLVHSHHTIAVHQQLGAAVAVYLDDLRREWRYDKDRRLGKDFKQRWVDKITPITARVNAWRVLPFSAVETLVGGFLKELRVLTINSESDDVLDYEREPGLKAIVVGGNRLSRGLTLENLLVSYFLRESAILDTLLQMGRWFGHRRAYVDLTRLYTTSTLMDWFQEVAAAEEELRDDIRLYAATGRTPIDFGPRVRSHPALRPTARNKMQHADEVSSSFAGHLKQTILFRLKDRSWLTANLEAARELVKKLGQPSEDGRLLWRGVPVDIVIDFLAKYRTHGGAGTVDADAIRGYISAQVKEKELLHWDILVRENEEASEELGQESLGLAGGRKVNRISRSRLAGTESIGILVNPAEKYTNTGDECVGMTDEQVASATKLMQHDPKLKWGRALRRSRDKDRGLLIVYPISPASMPKEIAGKESRQKREPLFPPNSRDATPTVIGIALVFPDSDSFATTGYWVGTPGVYTQS